MDISRLFKWQGVHIIKDAQGHYILGEDDEPLKVYLRVAGDADLDQIRRYALKESKKLRDSKELEALVPSMEDLTDEELISFIVLNQATEIYKEAEREVEIKFPRDNPTATLEEEERREEEVETYFDRLHDAVIQRTNEIVAERKEGLRGNKRERLLRLCVNASVNRLAEDYMLKAFNEALLYFTCFIDDKFTEKVFDSIEAARNAAPFLKEQLISAYNILYLKDTDLKK